MLRLVKTAAICSLATASPVMAQTKPSVATAPSGVCTRLISVYDGASKDLAANNAASIGDNSAPRATLRAMEDANTLTEARIALDLMRDNRCSLPKTTPSYIWYLSAALTCSTDRLKAGAGKSPTSCDRSTWTRIDAAQ